MWVVRSALSLRCLTAQRRVLPVVGPVQYSSSSSGKLICSSVVVSEKVKSSWRSLTVGHFHADIGRGSLLQRNRMAGDYYWASPGCLTCRALPCCA
ncbi:hypothetical protein C8F04DRAFT_63373 [Mycena alexandri]|uniref:Uncharacterized protein n=1 Tax=Mycena alexandri TaxID=1745969 RepID=A0AAD6X1A6_9AGAR|nr:hypothetical protein C8F04DRAFT_63373 [Mycena alexandri]